MKRFMMLFVIAVLCTAQIGCATERRQRCGNEERSRSHRGMTWGEAAFGAYITLGGQTLLGANNVGYAQVYSLTDRGINVRLSPITPNNGNWQVTDVKWSNGKRGNSTWVSNANYNNFTNAKVLMAVTVTWEERGLTTTADGKFQQSVRDSYTATFYFYVQHCARLVRHR